MKLHHFNTFQINSYFLPVLLNGDSEGLTQHEYAEYNKLIDSIPGNKTFRVLNDEGTFFAKCEICKMWANCYDVAIYTDCNFVLESMQRELQQCSKIPIFEIPAKDSEGNDAYIIFDIEFCEDTNAIIATHEALNNKQRDSDKIAFQSVQIDPDHSLDMHLEALHEECLQAIIDSDFFTINPE